VGSDSIRLDKVDSTLQDKEIIVVHTSSRSTIEEDHEVEDATYYLDGVPLIEHNEGLVFTPGHNEEVDSCRHERAMCEPHHLDEKKKIEKDEDTKQRFDRNPILLIWNSSLWLLHGQLLAVLERIVGNNEVPIKIIGEDMLMAIGLRVVKEKQFSVLCALGKTMTCPERGLRIQELSMEGSSFPEDFCNLCIEAGIKREFYVQQIGVLCLEELE
jgi:hypothetical protein